MELNDRLRGSNRDLLVLVTRNTLSPLNNKMSTTRAKRTGDVKVLMERIPVDLQDPVRRSSRTGVPPKRLQDSPDLPAADTAIKKRKTKGRNDENIPNKTLDPKKEEERSEHQSSGQGGLSLYELERLETIRQNQAFMSSINLFQATDELKQLSRPKALQRGFMSRSNTAAKEVLPPRKSRRLQNKDAEILTLPSEPNRKVLYREKPAGPLPMDTLNTEEGSKLPSQLLVICSENSMEERKVELDLQNYVSTLKKMKLAGERVTKVGKDRIFSAVFHPCSSSLLMAAGDQWGEVGLWTLGADWGDDGVLVFEPHTGPVCCMAFSRAQTTQLLSLSYDGSLRCMDIEKAVFDDVYGIKKGLKTFDFMSHDCSTLVVGSWYGDVAIIDRRTPGNSSESIHSLDPKGLRCVSVHPVQKHYFAVAESKTVSIYDSRCLKKTECQAVSQLHGHSLSISSAYFSPNTGNRVLTSCMDDHIRIYDTSAITTQSPLLTKIGHIMHTGLSAVWDPKQEDCFVVSSKLRPRTVQVFHESGRLQHSFRDNDHLTTVLSVTAFHPTRNALLGANASGRLHLFSD